uniref:Uncharacterized protein n=1 Tax=Arundo donax TaxID=35708 RepID=A0A0A8ZXM4_ARUDO
MTTKQQSTNYSTCHISIKKFEPTWQDNNASHIDDKSLSNVIEVHTFQKIDRNTIQKTFIGING